MRAIIEQRREVFSASFLGLFRQQIERNPETMDFRMEDGKAATHHSPFDKVYSYELKFRGPFTGQDYEYLSISIRTGFVIPNIPRGTSVRELAFLHAERKAFVWSEQLC